MAVRDIVCPSCDDAAPLQKVGLGRYRCTVCETTVDQDDVLPEEFR